MKTLFNVEGIIEDELHFRVTDMPNPLFVLPTNAWLDSRIGFLGAKNDTIYPIQDKYGNNHSVCIDQHRYSQIILNDDMLRCRPAEFVRRAVLPAVSGLSDNYNEHVLNTVGSVIVVRAPKVPSHVIGGYFNVNGVDIRWTIHWSSEHVSEVLTLDFYMGISEN